MMPEASLPHQRTKPPFSAISSPNQKRIKPPFSRVLLVSQKSKNMKREIIRIESIASIPLLREGWRNATKGDKSLRDSSKSYAVNLDRNLLSLSHRLLDGTFRPSAGHTFRMMTEGKWRDITSFPIEDRIVHYALVKVFNLSRHFVRRTHGSIKGRGCLSASKQVRRDLREICHNNPEADIYVLKLDCRKFYPSILKSRIKEKIAARYKGAAALRLMNAVIDAYLPDNPRGMSIGALISQELGNLFLSELDHFALQTIRAHYYTRYVDDITMIWPTKEQAIAAIPQLEQVAERDGLTFGRIELYPVRARRIDFCGYAVGITDSGNLTTRLRPKTVRRFRRRLHNAARRLTAANNERATVLASFVREPLISQTIASYEGIALHADTHNLLINIKRKYNEVYRTAN